jgi:hypothetical protein
VKPFVIASVLLILQASASTAWAIPSETDTAGAQADAYVRNITSASSFLTEIEQTIELALDGDYGRIKGADIDRMLAAHKTIKSLLDGHENARHLQPEQRIELYNAQETISAIVRNDEKNRKVCKRVSATGSRLTKAECMTVAQREARAKAVRESAWQQQQFREPPCEKRAGLRDGGC